MTLKKWSFRRTLFGRLVLQRTHVWRDYPYPSHCAETLVQRRDATTQDLIEFAQEKGNPLLIEIEASA